MGIKNMGIFNGTFSHNGNCKNYKNNWGNFIDALDQGGEVLEKFWQHRWKNYHMNIDQQWIIAL